MVAAELADTTKLLRVVVPRPLLWQTAELLQTRLGGLLCREVRHVPFSHKTATDQETIKTYAKIHKEIMANSGGSPGTYPVFHAERNPTIVRLPDSRSKTDGQDPGVDSESMSRCP
jgi:hypothetical protein